MVTAGVEKPASRSPYQPAAQQAKGALFQVPRMSFPRVCLSPGQQGKAHPHVVLSTFQSAMRAAQSLDILMERVIQRRHGWFSSGPGGQGPGPHSTPGCSHRGQASKGTCRSQRPSLVPRQGGLCLNYLTFTYIHQTKTLYLTPQATCSRSSLSLLLKNPSSCLL